ncbi:hypothetical protein M569_02134 [Genlisea aurea]|uniref:Fibronectin type-III domain-containing protein n=1 Tax=Genlisea aurea TaxID=192259 RepID=S8E9Q4_9LAMI|nr:hypothetical protein M569_02134 [Genlisea aurea]
MKRSSKLHELKKVSSIAKDPQHAQPRKQQRKSDNPVHLELCEDSKCSDSWICRNSACRASLSADDSFCRRCSCCICHLFDDNKDPSLWLECVSEPAAGDACGLSCHIECALQRGKVGVVDLGLLMQLDGSYCCASCGKVTGILGTWKKQLVIAKDARRVDILCYRIFLSYRLLDRTSRFSELHELVREAKASLETEVGPVDGVSAKMARGIVSRLSVAANVLRLVSLAVEKADEFMASRPAKSINLNEGSLPAACRFLFEEVTYSSIVVLLIELPTSSHEDIKGYKFWFCKAKEETYPNEPSCVFPRDQRRIWLSNLQPCTEYSFRVVSYTEGGDLGHSEVKCFTRSVEIIRKNGDSLHESPEKGGSSCGKRHCSRSSIDIESDSGFKVRDLGRILRLVLSQDQGCFESLRKCTCIPVPVAVKQETQEPPKAALPISRQLDLNVSSVPDLNEEFTPPVDSSRDDGIGCTLHAAGGDADDDGFSHVVQREGKQLSTCLRRIRSGVTNGELQDSNSTLTNGSPFRILPESGPLDENFEYCVKIIRWMECEGYIKKDFRLKLLTWFSLRSTEQERRVVNTFIQTLIDDPGSLAGQLVDSFSDIISRKRPRNGIFTQVSSCDSFDSRHTLNG